MKVKDAMHKKAEWVGPDTPISDVAKKMRDLDVGSIPVGENDRLIGMVIDRDINQAVAHRDGLSSRSSGQTPMPAWLARRLMPLFFTEQGENEKYVKQIRSSSGIAVFYSDQNNKKAWVTAGRAYQRFALQSTAMGLKQAFINQPVEVPELRRQLASFLNLGERRPDMIVRFGYAPALPRSLRRTVVDVLGPAY
jgi:hypothetical protein